MNTLWMITFVNSTLVLILVVVYLLFDRGWYSLVPWASVFGAIGVLASVYGAVVGTVTIVRDKKEVENQEVPSV